MISDSIEDKGIESAEDYIKKTLGEEIASEYTYKEETLNEIAWTRARYQSHGYEDIPITNSDIYIARHNGRFYAIIFEYNYKDASYKKALKELVNSVEFK